MTNQKQFGIWMDLHNATIVGKENTEEGNFVVIAHIEGEEIFSKPSEKAEHNHERTVETKIDISSIADKNTFSNCKS